MKILYEKEASLKSVKTLQTIVIPPSILTPHLKMKFLSPPSPSLQVVLKTLYLKMGREGAHYDKPKKIL